MLPLSANSDFSNRQDPVVINPWRDINGDDLAVNAEIFGVDAMDQAIEAILVTEPWERLFNLDFWSPFYKLLFKNEGDVDAIMTEMFDMIERYCAVIVDRSNTDVQVDIDNHAVSLKIPYWMNNGLIYHTFERVISA